MFRRYSLRTALIAFAILALLMATIGRRCAQARAQRAALDKLATLSGITGFKYDWDGDDHAPLNSNPSITEQLYRLPIFHKLFGQDFTNNVVEVEVHATNVSDNDLSFLKSFPRLRTLQLANVPINGDCLLNVAECSQMEALLISDAPLKDEHLRHAAGFRALQHIRLCFTDITDDGLTHITKLDSLRHVDLASTHVGDNGLVHLSGLKNLETLVLCDNLVTDAGLPALYSLKSLQAVSLTTGGFSDAAIASLQAQLPNCKIRFFTNVGR